MYIAPPGCGDLAFPSVQVQLLKPNMKPAARNFEIQRIVRRANVRRIRSSYEQLIKVQSAMKAGDNKTVEVSHAARLFAMPRFVDTLLLLLLPLSVSLSPILFFNSDEHLSVREHRIVCVRRAHGNCVCLVVSRTMCVRKLSRTGRQSEQRAPGKFRQSPGCPPRPGTCQDFRGPFRRLSRTGRQREESVCVRARAMTSMAFRDGSRSLIIDMRRSF